MRLKYIIFVLITGFVEISFSQGLSCENLFTQETFIKAGIGVIQNSDGSYGAGLKLSNYDRLPHATKTQVVLAKFLNSFLIPFTKYFKIDKLSGFADRLLKDIRPISYKHKLVEALNLKLKFNQELAAQNIPAEGALVVVGPHLSGGIDGMSMASVVSLFRKQDDVLIVLTNRLAAIDGIPENAVLIDDSETPESYENNKKPREQIIQHLKRGGAIVLFPSGNNATAHPLKSIAQNKKLTKSDYPYDALWMAGLTSFIKEVPSAQILPMSTDRYFSDTYQFAKANGGPLSALGVPNEISQHIGSTVEVKIGNILLGSDILQLAEDYVLDRELNSTEDLTPAKVDIDRARGKSGHEILVSNAFLAYLRTEVYQLLNVDQKNTEEMTPTQWMQALGRSNP